MAIATRAQAEQAMPAWEPRRGKRWSRSDGEAMVEAFEGSGMSVAEFARRHGLVDQRVHWWLTRRRRRNKGIAFAPVRLVDSRRGPVPSSVGAAPSQGRVEIVLRTGWVIRVDSEFDGETLRRVVQALDGETLRRVVQALEEGARC
jgi:transposase-like protein